jgi:hypothetical protein
MRELSDQAHGVNPDVGAELLNGLSAVDPTDVNVAKFVVYSLLGADYDDSPYTQQGERVRAAGRLWNPARDRAVPRRRHQDPQGRCQRRAPDRHGNGREPQEPVRWLWKYVDGARTAGEIYALALVVIAAEKYASGLVVPTSQRTHPTRWASHKDLAAKTLLKLARPHLPASQATRAGNHSRPSRIRHGNAPARRQPLSGAALRTDRNARRGTRQS